MYKIAYIVSTLKKSGPTEVLLNIIKFLDISKFKVTIITLSPESNSSSLYQFESIYNVEIVQLNLDRISGLFLLNGRLSNTLNQLHPDVIHSQGFRADLIVSLFFNKFNFVSTIHNNPFADYKFKYGEVIGSIIANIHKICLKRNPNSFIAVSKSILNIYKKKGINISCIQNGVDIEHFSQSTKEDKNLLKSKLDIPMDKDVFLTSGRLVKSKNLLTTIKGFNKFNEGDSILLIIGDGKEREFLNSFESESIVFVGFTDSILDYYRISDFFISSSLTEGFPMAVLESMAVGLSPILSDIEPHKEIISDTILPTFEATNANQLADCINNVVLNQKKYQEISLTLVKCNYTAELMTKKYQEMYLKQINQFNNTSV